MPFVKTKKEFESIYENYIFKPEYNKEGAVPQGLRYMQEIYAKKEKWAVAYSQSEIHTTSRVESFFAKIKRIVKQRSSL